MLALAACALIPLASWKFARLSGGAIKDARRLAQSQEARRLSAYGDCEGLGVGYLERTLRLLPDSAVMPLLRYGTPQPSPAALLNGPVRHLDRRVLVGIDVVPGEPAFAAELSGAPASSLPDGYTVVGREGRCFVALSDTFLSEMRAAQDSRWRDALERIGHAAVR